MTMRYPLLALVLVTFGTSRAEAGEIADAAMRADRAALEQALGKGLDVNAPQPDGATALHWAAYRSDAETVRRLLAAGAVPAVANRAGATPLSLACTAGGAEIVGLLLDAGADPNEQLRNGETALMMAARAGNVATVKLLLDRGANVNAAESLRGTTPLMWAVAYEHPEVAELLVERGADVAARSKPVPRGRRPYLADTTRSRIEDFKRGVGQAGRAIPVDLGGGGNSRPVSDEDLFGESAAATPAPAAAASPPSDEDIDAPPRNAGPEEWGGLTPLVFAARQGNLESARLLLEGGADVNQQTEYGWTALLAAIHNRYYRVALFLLEKGADPKLTNKGGWSPLYLATDNRNIEGGDYPTRKADLDHLTLIEALFASGADVNTRMRSSTETRTIFTHQWLHEEGATPLLRAAQSGDLALVKLFLERGADPSLTTDDGTTALMVAAGIGWVEGVTYEWSREQTLETVSLLLDLGVPVNAQNLDGQTALMGAAHKGRNDVVELLVARGADLALRDIGSRDTIHVLAGVTWQAIDYADGLVRVGVQSAIPHPETSALLRRLMTERGLPVPPPGRTLDSICVVEICK
jgi:ankyrin repeat protein